MGMLITTSVPKAGYGYLGYMYGWLSLLTTTKDKIESTTCIPLASPDVK
jgi:hypothetical protein